MEVLLWSGHRKVRVHLETECLGKTLCVSIASESWLHAGKEGEEVQSRLSLSPLMPLSFGDLGFTADN